MTEDGNATPEPETVEVLLAPTEDLVMEVLAARYRLGEKVWTMDSVHKRPLERLAAKGLAEWKSGVQEKTVLAWLTDRGKKMFLKDGYMSSDARAAAEQDPAKQPGVVQLPWAVFEKLTYKPADRIWPTPQLLTEMLRGVLEENLDAYLAQTRQVVREELGRRRTLDLREEQREDGTPRETEYQPPPVYGEKPGRRGPLDYGTVPLGTEAVKREWTDVSGTRWVETHVFGQEGMRRLWWDKSVGAWKVQFPPEQPEQSKPPKMPDGPDPRAGDEIPGLLGPQKQLLGPAVELLLEHFGIKLDKKDKKDKEDKKDGNDDA